MSSRHDSIVIGGGHNGLTAATVLAKAGERVLLLEARPQLGGLCARDEFHPGYAVPGLFHDTRAVRPAIADALDLARHGLRWRDPPRIAAPGPGGVAWIHPDRVEGLAEREQARFSAWRGLVVRLRPALARLLNRPAPDPAGDLWPLVLAAARVRFLGKHDMLELLRVLPMCAGDFLRDHFRDERLMAALALPAVEGCFTGPWSAGTAANLLLREAVSGREIDGGPAALVAALEQAARAHGVEIRAGAPVKRIAIERAAVAGVELQGGERIDAARVLSSADPKQTLLDLCGEAQLPARLSNDVRSIRTRGTTAQVLLALDGPLALHDGSEPEAVRVAGSLDAVERAFDAVKYGDFAQEPVLDARMYCGDHAPKGRTCVSLLVHAAPFERAGGWNDAAREALGEAAVQALSRHCPRVRERIVARVIRTPADLAARHRLSGGHIHHGEHALDQLLFMRPTAECARYATPIPGLWLCGSGCHPGGGVSCAPGMLAAKAVLG